MSGVPPDYRILSSATDPDHDAPAAIVLVTFDPASKWRGPDDAVGRDCSTSKSPTNSASPRQPIKAHVSGDPAKARRRKPHPGGDRPRRKSPVANGGRDTPVTAINSYSAATICRLRHWPIRARSRCRFGPACSAPAMVLFAPPGGGGNMRAANRAGDQDRRNGVAEAGGGLSRIAATPVAGESR